MASLMKSMAVAAEAAAQAAAAEAHRAAIREYTRQLRAFSTCDVGDALIRLGNKKGGHIYGISHATGTPAKICGPAVPVRMCNYGGGQGPAMKSLADYAESGKIMVIETPEGKSSKSAACWGANDSARAKMRQAEGVILGGNVRQMSICHEIGLPVFSRGTAALGTREFMRLGKVGEKITISGVDVHNNDIVLADENGVVVVLERQLKEVIASCEYGVKYNRIVREAIDSGSSADVAIRHADKILGKDPQERISPFRR